MSFRSIYNHGFVRVAACVPISRVADPTANAAAIIDIANVCNDRAVAVAVFPELCLSGYAIEDLLNQQSLLAAVERELRAIVDASSNWLTALVVGAPLRHGSRTYNCAAVVHRGRLLGVVPKSYLPTYREFYEARHFGAGRGLNNLEISVGAMKAPFGDDLLFEADDLPNLTVGIEVCEDMWVPVTPSSQLALAGASVIVNLSGSPITIGRARSRTLLCQAASARCLAAYVYTAAGKGKSSTDLAWDGQTSIFENGVLLAEGERFAQVRQIVIADVDLDLLVQERSAMGSFDHNRVHFETGVKHTVRSRSR